MAKGICDNIHLSNCGWEYSPKAPLAVLGEGGDCRRQQIIAPSQAGISLIELMLGIAISLIILAGVLTVMLRITQSGAESVEATRLNQQLRGSLDIISKELQRSGYVAWYEAWDDDDGDGVAMDSNDEATQSAVLVDSSGDGEINIMDYYLSVLPAIDRLGAVTLWSFPTAGQVGTPAACTTDCDCILYSYDLNEDGAQGIGSTGTPGSNQNDANVELFGFRWNDGAIEMRTGGSDHACDSGIWSDITDGGLEITGLTFSMTYADTVAAGNDSTVYTISDDGSFSMATTCSATVSGTFPGDDATADTLCLWRRKVEISLSGALESDADVTLTLNTDVKLKNDYFDSP